MDNHNLNIEQVNLYEILEIEQNATAETIRESYKKLTLKYHPDKQINTNLSEEEKTMKYIKIRDAYELLSDSCKRQKYDRELIGTTKIHNNFDNMIHEFKNTLTRTEYCVFMNILDNKIKQSLLNSIKVDDLLIQINQMNLMDVLQKFNNFKILDIDVRLDFTLYELYNNKYKIIKYDRISDKPFEEIIYPIDLIQIYENEGEIVKINGIDYRGNFIVNINVKTTTHNGINYQILDNDLYACITKSIFVHNNIIKIDFLNDQIHEIDILKIDKIITDFGFLYFIPDLGLGYYDTSTNIIDTEQLKIIRGRLYLLII
jgi:curved DNA-binding protein CbpA